jgi:thiol:disulfide interchange protein DsbA
MKKEDALHASVLRTWHVERKRLMSDDDNVAWAVKNGLDKKQFLEFYNSFAVMTKLRGVARLAAGYQVNSTPTLVVDGRYVTSPATVDAANPGTPYNTINKATLQVVQALVAKAAAAKAAK